MVGTILVGLGAMCEPSNSVAIGCGVKVDSVAQADSRNKMLAMVETDVMRILTARMDSIFASPWLVRRA
jgi:hypothetical protein